MEKRPELGARDGGGRGWARIDEAATRYLAAKGSATVAIEARDALVAACEGMLVAITSPTLRRLRHMDANDLMQEARICCLTAIATYDPGKGATFRSWAWTVIHRRLFRRVDQLNTLIAVPSDSYARISAKRTAVAGFARRHGRTPTAVELAALTGLPPTYLSYADMAVRACNVLEATPPECVGSDLPWDEGVSAEPDPATAAAEAEAREAAGDLLDCLHPRERYVMTKYYGLDGDRPETFQEIGACLSITKARVGQIAAKARERMQLHPGQVARLAAAVG